MTKIPKSYLQKAAQVFLFANTPRSLYRNFRNSEIVSLLISEWSCKELCAYFQKVSAKGEQGPMVVALSYAVLIALLIQNGPSGCPPEASRLRFAKMIIDFASEEMPEPSLIILPGTGNLVSPILKSEISYSK